MEWLSPDQAIRYLDDVMSTRKDISVVGIAGPGDPFANPFETIRTLELVREKYPDMILCLASNGLNVLPYVKDIVRLNVSHVSITVNAVDPEVGAKIYAWVRDGKRSIGPQEGAKLMLEKQLAAIKALKENNVLVKVNCVVVPGINSHHVVEVAKKMGELGVEIFNCMPYYPNPGSNFEHIGEPEKDEINAMRKESEKYVKQMRHCRRCRSDAVGLLGEIETPEAMEKLRSYEKGLTLVSKIEKPAPERPFVAVASMEGMLVNLHLGEATQLFIYNRRGIDVVLEDVREVPEPGGGIKRWEELSEVIKDCGSLLVSSAGNTPKTVLGRNGITVYEVEGVIEEAVYRVFEGKSLNHMIKRKPKKCGSECEGTGMGCL